MLRLPIGRIATTLPRGLPGLRRLWFASLGYVFGPPPFRTDRPEPGTPGLFGPGSASWSIVAEPAGIIGGVRALLVQLLHPLAMAGVADHSGFREDPLARLRSTSAYVTTTTFGTTAEALAVARRVRAVHRHVRGVAPDGRDYRADDPHLLAWVSVAFTASLLATDRAYAPRPADPETADRFVAEQSRAAALLDPRVDLEPFDRDPEAARALGEGSAALPMIEERRLPRDVAELDAMTEAYRPELEVNEQGRDALRFLIWPRVPPPVKAAYLPLMGGAVATLAPYERRLLGLPAPGAVLLPARLDRKSVV